MKKVIFNLPDLFVEKFQILCKNKGMSSSGFLRKLVLQELAAAKLVTIQEIIDNQMTEQTYNNASGKKRGRPIKNKSTQSSVYENIRAKVQAKTLLD